MFILADGVKGCGIIATFPRDEFCWRGMGRVGTDIFSKRKADGGLGLK